MKSILTLLILAVLFSLYGCQQPSKVTGGTARHDQGSFAVTYTPPGGGRVDITDSREVVATTQPSVTSTGDVTKIRTQSAEEGGIGGVTFDGKIIQKTPTQWGFIIALAVIGAATGYLRYYYVAAGCLAGIILAFFAPATLPFIAFGIIGLMVFLFLKSHKDAAKVVTQLVAGNQNAVNVLPPSQAEAVKAEWDKSQDASVKQTVKDVKAELPAASITATA